MSEATAPSTTAAADGAKSAAKAATGGGSTGRPIHPAVLTTFGPGRGSGSSELSAWAYLTRPRPRGGDGSTGRASLDAPLDGDDGNGAIDDASLPNLVTAQSNSLRVYTVLPNAGTLALTAVYDNLAGTVCSLDVIANGTGGRRRGHNSIEIGGKGGSAGVKDDDDDGLREIFAEDGNSNSSNNNNQVLYGCTYDGILLGFAGHPRLSVAYPSASMVESGAGGSSGSVGQGGVLLASSIVDLTPALIERGVGGTSFLEQDVVVSVSASNAPVLDVDRDGDDGDLSVSVVLGGGVAIASFSLPRAPRPDEAGSSPSSSSWWRIATEPYVLPLHTLSTRVRDLGSAGDSSAPIPPPHGGVAAGIPWRRGQQQPNSGAGAGLGPSASHGLGDVVDIAFLSGYTEPTLLILHSNPRRGGGRAWAGRLGRTAEVPLPTPSGAAANADGEDDMEAKEHGERAAKKNCIALTAFTGTKYGLTLTCVSLSVHHARSVVLWSLVDALPADAWKLIPHPANGALVWGVNTVVYVSMGGRIKCALAVNGFAKIGCPAGLLPPPPFASAAGQRGENVHLEPNPVPLPPLALQLDGSRASFVSLDVALVCLGNGTLHSLELHNNNGSCGLGKRKRMFMSLFPLGYRIGGLGGAVSCLSTLAAGYHERSFRRYLKNGGLADVPKKEGKAKAVASSSGKLLGPRVWARGLVFVGSRMGDCTLLVFSMNEPVRLLSADIDVDDDQGAARRDDPGSIALLTPKIAKGEEREPARKHPKLEDSRAAAVVVDGNDNADAADANIVNGGSAKIRLPSSPLTEAEILHLEEEELYREGDNGTPTIISSSRADSDDFSEEGSRLDSDQECGSDGETPPFRAVARRLSRFGFLRALDSLTGLGPLGRGCHGPVATYPSLTPKQEEDAVAPAEETLSAVAIFSSAFSSATQHYILPCGFGSSGGLAVLTTPGRDNVGGSILCESDLCSVAHGAVFGLGRSNLVLLGKSDGAGCIVLRGVARKEEGGVGQVKGGCLEEFEELDIAGGGNTMDVDGAVTQSSLDLIDVLGKMTLLAASEFCPSNSRHFVVFFVRHLHSLDSDDDDDYSIIIMSNVDDDRQESTEDDIGLRVNFVYRVKSNNDSYTVTRGALASITAMASDMSPSDDVKPSLSVTFGCVWTSGIASVFNISLSWVGEEITPSSQVKFEVSESIFVGDDGNDGTDGDGEVSFYDSSRIVAMDIISLPAHIFDASNSSSTQEKELPLTASAPIPDLSSPLSFRPDRLSMHGTWHGEPSGATARNNRIVIAICRRSGLLQIYDNKTVLGKPLIHFPPSSAALLNNYGSNSCLLPIWQAEGCSHGTVVLKQSSPGITSIRRPDLHEVEAAEIRLFVAGPSLPQRSDEGNWIEADAKMDDAWMLRSLCILVNTSIGDLHLYSGSKRGPPYDGSTLLEFLRVPLSNVARPSDEAGRHLTKLRRKDIVPPSSIANPAPVFRPNRLHRFIDISGQDGLFASTPRPLWLVSERGAMAAVSHKSRHVSPAGARPMSVLGFCATLPDAFQNAKSGFITVHERIGRVGSQRLTLYNGLWDVFTPHGLLPGGGVSVQKIPLGVTVRHIEFIDDASISSTCRPVYAALISHEIEADQSYLNDDGLTPEERQRIRDEKEAARVRKQVEADLGGFDMEQEWVEEIEREDCFAIDMRLGLAPPMPSRKYEVWLLNASSGWNILDKYQLEEFEHGTSLKVMYLTDVVEDSDEAPGSILVIGVGTSIIDQDGEDLASKGRILLFQVNKCKKRALGNIDNAVGSPLELVLRSEKAMALGPVTSLSSLRSEDIYRVVVGAGAEVTVEQWGGGKLTQVGFYHAHMQVQQIVLFKTFFLLSDAYDSLHFLVWRESDKSLTLLAKDYEPTQVFATGLISRGGAMSFVCHDDRQNLSFLQYAPTDAAARGGNKLVCRADFHMGSQTTSFKSHWCQSSLLFNSCTTTSTLAALKQQDALFGRLEDDQRFGVNFGSSEGSFGSIVPLSEPTYWRLTALQSVMSNALESNCALSHRAWRLYRRSTRRAGCRSNDRKKGVIDGDLVMKFVDLPLPEQEDFASSIGSTVGLVMDNLLELGCAASVI